MSDIDAALHALSACDYEPIEAYAVIGDCRSAALVSRTGSIDWLCWPHFSAPSLFAALLDRRKGGRFLVRPREIVRIERRYLGRSGVLETTFHCTSGTVKLTDFMPLPVAEDSPHRLLRLVECGEGEVIVDVACQPRPDYGRRLPEEVRKGDSGWLFRLGEGALLFQADAPLAATAEGDLVAGGCRLTAGQRHCFAVIYGRGEADVQAGASRDQLLLTLQWWEAWAGRCTYQGPYSQAVMNSCRTLKMLAHRTSGAVVASPTTSLPETLDAGRNWDYRYCWLRDTSLLLQSFVDLGFPKESGAFLGWLLRAGRKPRLQPLYDLHGHPVPDEAVLSHLEGYRGRGPVRIGNAAHRQLQLDIYGEVIQTAYRFVARGGRLSNGEKRLLAGLGEAVSRLWRQPDQSIWEARSPPRHYTYSKLMCWVALDRLLTLRQQLYPIEIAAKDLQEERDLIRQSIESRGFDPGLGSYVAYFGGSEPDASLLLMARYGYVEAENPRIRGTCRYIMNRLAVDGFLYRYPPGQDYDGVEGQDNLFAVCSFWAVDYLARSGEIEQATRLFERLLEVANDVGLYAEQFDRKDRSALGNFPQAFTHSGLITAALAIEQSRKGRRGGQIAA